MSDPWDSHEIDRMKYVILALTPDECKAALDALRFASPVHEFGHVRRALMSAVGNEINRGLQIFDEETT